MKVLKASAGSGKTYALAYEYIKSVISNPENYSSILAVTFTNKATDEMKGRIIKELDALKNPLHPSVHPYLKDLLKETDVKDSDEIAKRASTALSNILHDYSRFSIFTIDSFFQKIIRSFVRELGLESDYNIDFDEDYLLKLTIDRVIDDSTQDPTTYKLLDDFNNENLEKGKKIVTEELVKFSKIILTEEYNSDKISSKTESYTTFIEKIFELHKEVLSLISQQAEVIISKVEGNGYSVNDLPYKSGGFYSFVKSCQKEEIKRPGKRTLVAANGGANWKDAPQLEDIITPELKILIDLVTNNIRFICSVGLCKKIYRKYLLLGAIDSKFAEVCNERNIMMLSTTTRLLTTLIAENDAPFIYEKCGNSYSIFMIDEFQDTSVRQWKNFTPLLNNAMSQCEEGLSCVTIVGDVKQSIYRFRGGDWKLLKGDLKQDILFPNKIQEQTLETNWRSKRAIIAFNNSVIKGVVESVSNELESKLNLTKENGAITNEQKNHFQSMLKEAYVKSEQKYASKNRDTEGYIEITKCDFDEEQNLKEMILAIEDLQRRGCAPKDIAILTCEKKEARKAVEALLEYKNQHPESQFCYDAISNEALYIGSSDAVKFIICALRLTINSLSQNALIIAEFNMRLGKRFNEPLSDYHELLFNQLRQLSFIEAIERIITEFDVAKTASDVAYVQALYEQIYNFNSSAIADITRFLEYWDEKGYKQSITMPSGQNAINVLTIHKSKGLEYKAVIIPYLNWSTVPRPGEKIWIKEANGAFCQSDDTLITYENSMEDSEFGYTYVKELTMSLVDRVNLLYVALTRAESELYIYVPEKGAGISKHFTPLFKPQDNKVSLRWTPEEHIEKIEGAEVEITGVASLEEDKFIFGKREIYPIAETKSSDTTDIIVDSYKSCDYMADDRAQLRYSTERYYIDEKGEKSLTPRSYGILMHRLFERIDSYEDIPKVAEQMCYDGELDSDEKASLLTLIEGALKRDELSQFFELGWKVKNEQNILIPLPNNSSGILQRRPDRVVISEGRAKVLDYKFGRSKDKKHQKQIEEYIMLLKQMGYEDVEGYIWYVQLSEVEKVN